MLLLAFRAMVLCYAAGAAASIVLARRSSRAGSRIGHGAAFLGASAGVVAGLGALLGPKDGGPLEIVLPSPFPFARLAFALDGLSAFFLLVISFVTAAAALYAPAYLALHHRHVPGAADAPGDDHSPLPGRPGTPAAGPAGPGEAVAAFLLNAFVLSMVLVVCAADAFVFLLLWEMMTFASYFLVVFSTREKRAIRAGFIYVVTAHAGTAFLLFAFLYLSQRAHGFDFASLREAASALEPGERTALFLALFVGFGTKAGLIPFHVWLPYAHPEAPSHVSALMSGVMIKTAVYGMLRFGLGMLAAAPAAVPASWGVIVLAVGTLSAVFGVLYALQEHDLKRLLAYHSVENMGIIFMGIGTALLFLSAGEPALAPLGLAAALYHTANHASFKGLLFLGAGSVQVRARTLNIEEMGGLARGMPWTAGLFLLGSAAISALPPLNGFVSEWLTFQALLHQGTRSHGWLRLASAGSAALLALTSGLAAACFAKAFGIVFLGRARSADARAAREAPRTMLAGPLALGAACVLLGVAPGAMIGALDGPLEIVLPGHPASAVLAARGPLVLAAGAPGGALPAGAVIATGLIAIFLAGLTILFAAATRRLRGSTRLAETWTCGMTPSARFCYTAHAFSKAIRLIFAPIYRPSRRLTEEFSRPPYFRSRLTYHGRVEDVIEHRIYRPLNRVLLRNSARVRSLHTGSIHLYIAAVLAALVVSLLLLGGSGP
jgi:hydrogenase-4 component B